MTQTNTTDTKAIHPSSFSVTDSPRQATYTFTVNKKKKKKSKKKAKEKEEKKKRKKKEKKHRTNSVMFVISSVYRFNNHANSSIRRGLPRK